MNIAFCHNTSGNTVIRYKILEETVHRERSAFPKSQHFTFCDGIPFKFDHPVLFSNKQLGHKIGSLHGFIRSMQLAMMYSDADIFVFSHDDVYLEDLNSFNRCLNMVHSGSHSMVARQFPDFKHPDLFDVNYISFESIVLSRDTANEIIDAFVYSGVSSESDIIRDFRDSPSPELQIGEYTKNVKDRYFFDLPSNQYGLNEMGYHHKELKRGYGWV